VFPTWQPGSKRIWMHAVSLGEVKSLRYLLKQPEFSKQTIVLTVSTPTGYNYAKQEYRQITVLPSPLDCSWILKQFFEKILPEKIILNELEIWPNWIRLAEKKKVPVIVINGRISERAFQRYQRFLCFFKKSFSRISLFLVQGEIYKQRFEQLAIPAEKIQVCGNIKADEACQSLLSLESADQIFLYLKINSDASKPILTLASTHGDDEAFFYSCLPELMKMFSIILVPRHLTRVAEIQKKLLSKAIPHVIWSRENRINLEKSVLIFDEIGYLFNIYKISDLVFMGGTFSKKISGHNFYEPAILGKMIISGPHYSNFIDIAEPLIAAGVVRLVEKPAQVLDIVNSLSREYLAEIGKRGLESVKQKQGSTACIVKKIQSLN
jgi:3-deoxy-D-manno-octulosonic-acid transferase